MENKVKINLDYNIEGDIRGEREKNISFLASANDHTNSIKISLEIKLDKTIKGCPEKE